MVAEPIVVAADRRQAVGIDDRPAHAAVAAHPAPAQRSGSMARSCNRGQHQVAEPDFAIVADHPTDRGWRKGLVDAGLRVVGARRPGFEHLRRRSRGDERRAAQPLQLCNAADMVEMLMAVQDELHVLQPEAKRADVVGDDVRALLGPAVDQDVAVAADDQDRGNATGTDEIGVGVDADRRRRLVPGVGILRTVANSRPARPGAFDRRSRLLDDARRLAEGDGDLRRRQQRDDQRASEHSSHR